MICISVTPSSRRLAPADLLNASRKADLIELCLDSFIKTPDVADLLKLCDKPVLVSCRRKKDGGNWAGTEEERMALLRNTIVAGPEYVELELDIADKVPRFGKTKRVISHTSLNRPLGKIDDIFEQCYKAKADVVKFTWLTEDLDAAWPLLKAVSQSRELPVVGQGIGQSGLTFSLLGRKYGSPWVYAALEKGMETHDAQPTVWQLEQYCWGDISKKTRFIGVVGMGAAENTTVRVLNAAFQELDKPIRCLPLIPGRTERLEKALSIMKINALLVDPLYDGDLGSMCSPGDEIARQTGFMDLITNGKAGWSGRSTLFQALHTTTTAAKESESWMQGRAITVFGTGPTASAMINYLQSHNAAVSVAAPSDNAGMGMAKKASVRHIPWSAVHATATDGVILAGPEIKCGTSRGELNPSLIRERTTVIDLTQYPGESDFAEESRARGAIYVNPSAMFAEQLKLQFKSLTNMDMPMTAFQKGLSDD